MKKIIFNENADAESVFFFGKTEEQGTRRLFRNFGNAYTTELRGKYIVVDDKISNDFPDYCYLKINSAMELEKVFVVTDANLITPKKTTISQLGDLNLVSRPKFVVNDTIKYYNAKSIKGNIDCLVITYKMVDVPTKLKELSEIFYDCYLNCNGHFISVVIPENIYMWSRNVLDYSLLYFKDFELIK